MLKKKYKNMLGFPLSPLLSLINKALESTLFEQFRGKIIMYAYEGIKLIELILSQMNENRLSSSGVKLVERDFLQSEVTRFLKGPSNYEIREGRIFIKSLNKYHSGRTKTKVELKDQEGLVFKTFDSMNKCA
jgi:hypothetical protein